MKPPSPPFWPVLAGLAEKSPVGEGEKTKAGFFLTFWFQKNMAARVFRQKRRQT
jgi:hypothetical protein